MCPVAVLRSALEVHGGRGGMSCPKPPPQPGTPLGSENSNWLYWKGLCGFHRLLNQDPWGKADFTLIQARGDPGQYGLPYEVDSCCYGRGSGRGCTAAFLSCVRRPPQNLPLLLPCLATPFLLLIWGLLHHTWEPLRLLHSRFTESVQSSLSGAQRWKTRPPRFNTKMNWWILVSSWEGVRLLAFSFKHLFPCWECNGSLHLLGMGIVCTLRSCHLHMRS